MSCRRMGMACLRLLQTCSYNDASAKCNDAACNMANFSWTWLPNYTFSSKVAMYGTANFPTLGNEPIYLGPKCTSCYVPDSPSLAPVTATGGLHG